MPLTKLQFRPGINRETTSYSNEGGWFDMDKVRFRFGYPEKIGGWEKSSSTYFLGTCRALHPWVALNGERYLGVGTHLKYYINEGPNSTCAVWSLTVRENCLKLGSAAEVAVCV